MYISHNCFVQPLSCSILLLLGIVASFSLPGKASVFTNVDITSITRNEDIGQAVFDLNVLDNRLDPNNASSVNGSEMLSGPPEFTVSCAEQSAASNGNTDGVAVITPGGGGVPNYNYTLTGPDNRTGVRTNSNSFELENLPPGDYTLEMTDANGAIASCIFTITEDDPVCDLTLNGVGIDISCTGAGDGAIDLDIISANGAVDIDWSDDTYDGIEDPTDITVPGDYTVTVTDAAGCMAELTTVVADAGPAFTLSCAEQSPASNGNEDGVAVITPDGGGTPNYNYTLTGPDNRTGVRTNANSFQLQNLSPGDYTLEMTDANGCTALCTFTITEDDPVCDLTLNAVGTAISCAGAGDGGIDLNITGANGTVVIDWSDDTYDGVEDPTDIATAGTYTVIVTDANGCNATIDVIISEPDPIVLDCSTTTDPTTVGGTDGSATPSFTGGTPPYEITWNGPEMGSQSNVTSSSFLISNLSEGTYTVVVTDVNGCTADCLFTLNDPACNLTLGATSTDISCSGAGDGRIELTITNANGAVNIDWSDDTYDGIEDPTGIMNPGTYAVVVTDAVGCTTTTNVTINEPDPVALDCSTTSNPTTVGGMDGSATPSFNGGTPPYQITWNGPVMGSETNIVDNFFMIPDLSAGTYTVVVTDANGCTADCLFTINPIGCDLTVSVAASMDIFCNGADEGSIDLTIQSSQAITTIDWSDNTYDGVEDPTGITSAGEYTVTITDAVGCVATTSVTINETNPLLLDCANRTNPTSVGGTNGSVTLLFGNGASPYQVNWNGPVSGSQTNITNNTFLISGLSAGDYTVNLTDANGCQQTCSFTLLNPGCDLTISAVATDISCNGAGDGSIDLTIQSTQVTIGIDWSDDTYDNIEDPIDIATGGIYTVNVTDAIGCTATTNVTIREPDPLLLDCTTTTNPTTVGGTEGTATPSFDGGTAPYQISWDGPAAGSQSNIAGSSFLISGLPSGIYTVDIMDANNCEQTCSFTLTEPVCDLTLDAIATDISCSGAGDGSIDVMVTGGTAPFQYDWSDDTYNGTEDPGGISIAGEYTVIVTDAIGCTAMITVTVNEPDLLVLDCTDTTDPTTTGGMEGTATPAFSGGTPPYEITWNGPVMGSQSDLTSSTFLIAGLSSGTYTVDITDANGCQENCSFTLNEPVCDLSLTTTATNISCNGAGDGNIELTIQSDRTIINIDWSDDTYDGIEDPTDITIAGEYIVTVTNAAGCSATTSVSISEPGPVILDCSTTTDPTNVGGADGSATPSFMGGTPPYQIAWNGPITGSETDIVDNFYLISNLSAGTYTIVVTDDNGCEETCEFTLVESCDLIIEANAMDISCAGAGDGSIDLTIQSSQTITTINWSDDTYDSVEDPMNIAVAGEYSVTVTDAMNCTATASVTISEPDPIILDCSTTSDPTIINGTDGSATPTFTGGTPPYQIAWNGPTTGSETNIVDNSFVISNLPAGIYTVVVTDDNGCEETCEFTIIESTCDLMVGANATDISCAGASDGGIDLAIQGSQAIATINWSDDTYDGIEDPIGIAVAGEYSVTVTDVTGCTATTSVSISEPNPILLDCSTTSDPTTVGGADGSATPSFTDGIPPYQINWSGPTTGSEANIVDNSFIISNLPAGTYNVIVTDNNGCESTCAFELDEPCDLTIGASATDISCAGGSNGNIDLTIQSSQAITTINWSDDTFDGIEDPMDIAVAGEYSVTVTDAGDCTATTSVTISESSPILLNCSTISDPTTIGGTDGSATPTFTGGTPPYQIAWNGPATGSETNIADNSFLISNLPAGTYTVVVTDDNGCEETCAFALAEPCDLTVDADATNISCAGGSDGGIDLTIQSSRTITTINWSDDTYDEVEDPMNIAVAGEYSVTVTDAAGCTATTSVTISEPNPIVLDCNTISDPTTVGGTDGSATPTFTGGTPPYQLDWSGLVSGQTNTSDNSFLITDLPAGAYMIVISDANGCTTDCTFTLNDPIICDLTVEIAGSTDITCSGANDGNIDLTIQSSRTITTIDWNDDIYDGVEDPMNIAIAGEYSVMVTDAAGCTATTSVTINETNPLLLDCTTTTNPTNIGGTNGSVTLFFDNGTSPYQTNWNGPVSGTQTNIADNTFLIAGLSAGDYTVDLTDANGCQQTCSFTLFDPGCDLTIDAVAVNISCNGVGDGSIDLSMQSTQTIVDIDWSDDAYDGIEDPANITVAGMYTVNVTDAIGCMATTNVTINEPNPLLLDCAVATNPTTIGGTEGTATPSFNGGTPPYQLSWDGPVVGNQSNITNNSFSISDLSVGTYTIDLTDANGCQETCSFTLTEPVCDLTLNAIATDVSCSGAGDGSIDVMVTGGSSPFQYDWSDDTYDGTEDPMNVAAAGEYTVIVTDAVGCTATTTVTLNETDPLILDCTNTTDPTTTGGMEGIVTPAFSGGTPPYQIIWNGPVMGSQSNLIGNTFLIAGLSAGTYTIDLTDANGCQDNCSFTLSGPACNLSLTTTAMDISCNGAADGSIDLSIQSDQAIISIDWSDDTYDGIEDPANIAIAGEYIVTVTNLQGCSTTTSVTINEPNPIILDCNTTTDPTTVGGTDGSATPNFTDGTPPYQLDWSGPVSGQANTSDSSFLITDLPAGTYDLAISDANGCTADCSFTLNEPVCDLVVDAIVTDISCAGGSNGSIDLTIQSSQTITTIDWSDNTYDSIEDPMGIAVAGEYAVTVTDAVGCTDTTSVTISEPNPIVLDCNTTSDPTTINGTDGSAASAFTGGTPPYQLDWSGPVGGQADTPNNTFLISDLPAGTYVVTISDANACTESCSFTLSEPSCDLIASAVVADISCNGATDGSIDLTVTGGNAPFQYDWSDDTFDGMEDPTGIASAGEYTVTVTDVIGCTATTSVTVSMLPDVATTCQVLQSPGNAGANNGSINVNITQGAPIPYTITYGNGAGENGTLTGNLGNNTIGSLPEGTYTISVTGQAECTATCIVELTPIPCSLTLNTFAVGESCIGAEDGQVTVVTSGGGAPYRFLWNTGDTTASVNNLPPGAYQVEVTDGLGCTEEATTIVAIGSPLPEVVIGDGGDICNTFCYNLPLDFTSANFPVMLDYQIISNGVVLEARRQNFSASNEELIICPEAEGLTPGDFQLRFRVLTDLVTACTVRFDETRNFTYAAPITGSFNPTLCFGDSIVIEGTVFDADNPVGEINLPGAAANGCDSLAQIDLTFLPISIGSLDTTLCAGASLTIGSQTFNAASPTGIVVLTGGGANGCDSTVFVTTMYRDSIIASMSADQTICSGADASVTLSFNNPGIYDFSLRNSDGTEVTETGWDGANDYVLNLPGLTNNTSITVTSITEEEGCEVIMLDNDTQITLIDFTIDLIANNGTTVSCAGAADGQLSATVNVGQGPFSYLWSTGATTSEINNLSTGTYTVSVSDVTACTVIDSLTITDPLPIVVLARTEPATCVASRTGTIIIDSIAGGSAPYEYSLDGEFFIPANNLPISIANQATGEYTLFVQDALDCSTTFDLIVPDGPNLMLQINDTTDVVTIALGDSILFAPSYNFAPASWTWTPITSLSQPDSIITYVTPNSTTRYRLEMVDINGCSISDAIRVIVDQNLPIYVPTAFSPNGDGSNDVFMIYGKGVEEIEAFQVFDRWGTQVFSDSNFQPNDPMHGWDGTVGGTLLNSGVFVYWARAKLPSGESVVLKGEFVLLR